MKKFLYSIILCLGFIGTGICQDEQRPKDKFFFNEFYFNANTSLPEHGNNNWGVGGGIGFVHVAFKEEYQNLVFGLELNSFETYSSIYSDDKYTSYKNVQASVLAINIPLSFRFNFGEVKRFYLQGGFSADLNLFTGGRGLYSSYGPTFQYPTITDQPTDTISLRPKTSYSARVGIGYKTIVKKRNLAIQLEYLYNLSPVIQGEMDGTFQSQYFRLNLVMSSKN
jgi:hypothetical protein